MSWVKKREAQAPPPTQPPVQMYNPNQHSSQENQWQQQQDNWYNQPQKQERDNYWQQSYQQPYTQNNVPQYGQYPEYYQNNTTYQQPYGNLQYNQHYNTHNNYSTQPPQTEGDGWTSNWGWGDEDNSNIQTPSTTNVADSFTNDEAWNWGADDTNLKSPNKITETDAESVKAEKHNKLETPQWSVESQLSQESCDDILQTSESDKSRMLSRSSTISHSPISGQEPPPGAHGGIERRTKGIGGGIRLRTTETRSMISYVKFHEEVLESCILRRRNKNLAISYLDRYRDVVNANVFLGSEMLRIRKWQKFSKKFLTQSIEIC